MKSNFDKEKLSSAPPPPEQAIRPAFRYGAAFLIIACLAAGVVFLKKRPAADPGGESPTPQESADNSSQKPAAADSHPDESLPVEVTNQSASLAPSGTAAVPPKRTRPAVITAAPVARPEPSPFTRQLVNSLVDLKQAGAPQTKEQAEAWKQNLQQLVQQGPAALPAIQEFLEKNVDSVFGGEASRMLGYGSARNAMFDALAQMGGPDALGMLAGTLQTTADPREIATLARTLEQSAPEQYRQQILDASRQVLALAADAKTSDLEVAPLFEVLGKYGGPGAIPEIEQASARWKYYSAIALADMPDGTGVPSLIHSVQDSGGGPVKNIAALEMLTQVASQSPDARAALLQEVRANNLAAHTWAYLTPILAGDQLQFLDSALGNPGPPANNSDLRTFHIASGNQNFYTAPPPGGLTADQINQRLGLIDELLGATANPAAVQALQSSRVALLKRTPQTAAVVPPP